MKVDERQRRYQWLRDDRTAWKLLCAQNAPLILGFLGELFENAPEVPIDRARTELEIQLRKRPTSEGEPAAVARIYINQWVDAGYLREQNQKVAITSVVQTALQFADSFDRREIMATASHLETVNQEMHRLLIELSPDSAERQRLIDDQIKVLEQSKNDLLEGRVSELSPAQKREKVRHLYALASALTHDFRFLEEEMRVHETAIRQRILEEAETRGSVLGGLLDADDLMGQSPAGQAFDGFYALLGDQDRSEAFRGQIKRLMALGVSAFLSSDETRYFVDLVTQLLKLSERLIARRRSTVESLRTYMLSGAHREHRAVDRLLKQAERLAATLQHRHDIDWYAETAITLNTGKLRLSTPRAVSTTLPDPPTDPLEIVDAPTLRDLHDADLEQFGSLRVIEVAQRVLDVLRRTGSRTLGDLAAEEPVTQGVEEVIALIRIAQAVGAIDFQAPPETIYFRDKSQRLFRAQVPTLQLSAGQFPDDLSDLNP